jgi:hypothetical protein
MGAAKMRDGKGKEPTGKIGRGYRAPAAVLLPGLLAAVLLVWTYVIGKRQDKVFAWGDDAMWVDISQ